MTSSTKVKQSIEDYVTSAGVPVSEFDADFVVKMISAMMVSYHKYGLVAKAYPAKYSAESDVRTRMGKYRAGANKHYLVDAANFAMIEAMHPNREGSAWGENDAADSPGRSAIAGRKLITEDNDGNRIAGDFVLHHPEDEEGE
jgi:hypothetical protein